MRPIALSLAVLFIGGNAMAYTEMVRHGYNQCSACHISPSGGFLLTQYGRELSREVLTTWGREGEEQPIHGLYHEAKWLRVGGHLRAVQTYVDNPVETKGAFFPMQMEVDAAVETEKTVVAASVAVEGQKDIKDRKVMSPQHWIQNRQMEKLWVRAGRFDIPFGLNTINHTSVTEQDLGFGPGTEPYGFELFSNLDIVEIQVAGYIPARDQRARDLESGYGANLQITAIENQRFGLSFAHLRTDIQVRDLLSLSGAHKILERVVLLHESDLQWKKRQRGSVHLAKLDYEPVKGFHMAPVAELSYLDWENVLIRKTKIGFDLNFFPRPHFDIQISYRKEESQQLYESPYDVAYAVLHYWL